MSVYIAEQYWAVVAERNAALNRAERAGAKLAEAEAKLAEVRERCKQAMERGEGAYAYVLAHEITNMLDKEQGNG